MGSEMCIRDSPYCLLVSPLLLETDQAKAVDRVLVIDVSKDTQLARTLQRDRSSLETIEAIIEAQIARPDRLARADDIISNEADLASLADAVLAQHKQYCVMSKAAQMSKPNE